MDNKFNNIDDIFAKSLGDHSIDPPASVWDKIQGQLDASASSHPIDKVFEKGLGEHTMQPPPYVWENIKGTLDLAVGRRRRIIGWIAGTASAVVIAFVGGYFIANSFSNNSTDESTSQKISSGHNVQIDVNHFWNLRHIEAIGETTSGGHSYTNTIPGSVGDNSMNNSNRYNQTNTNNDGYGYKETNDTHPGYFGTHSKEDFQDNRRTPNGNIQQHNPNVPSENQPNGDDVKKINAVTSDVNGPVETQIGTRGGSSNVAANNNSTNVIVNESSTNNTNSNDNNDQNKITLVEENRPESVNPNDPTTFDNTIDDSERTFTIMPYFSPTYTFRNSKMLNTSGIQNSFDTSNGNSAFIENANFSYSAGVLVGYNFTPRLTVFIGASFNSFSNTTGRNNIHSRSFDQVPTGDSTVAITSAGEISGLNIIPTLGTPESPTYIQEDQIMNPAEIGSIKRITQTFSYVEVPVLVRYKFFGKKVGLTLTGGLSTGFMVQNDVFAESDVETKRIGETSQIRNFNMNALIGVGIEAKLLPFMYLNIEPTFRYSFLNWSMDTRFQMNPISIGLNTGLSFKF